MPTSLFQDLKQYYEENELYCSICLERGTIKHWVLSTCEGILLSREDMEYELIRRGKTVRPHYTTQQNEHYGVGYNNEYVLVQIQGAVGNTIEQVRIPLTVDEAEHMITLLQKAIEDHNMTDQKPQQTSPPQPKPQLPPLKDIKEGWIPLNG
jgi:hypothetical protein